MAMVSSATDGGGVVVGVWVTVAVGVAVTVGVGVGVTVPAAEVGVELTVAVAVGVLVAEGVLVGVLVAVAVGVAPMIEVLMVTELFASSPSDTTSSGSTVALLLAEMSTPVVTKPVIVTTPTALGPVANEPRSQSRLPPVTPPWSEQIPLVVLNPVYVKFTAG